MAAGIENVRALGIDYGAQARSLLDKLYPRAYRLADLGYTLCFEMLLPEMEAAIPADRPDLVLIDVVDPDFLFVDRLEKERIAEDYRLNLAALHGRLQGGSEAGDVYKRLRALEYIAQREGIEGYVAKARFADSDQMFLKVKPASVREAHRVFSGGDLKAVYEAVREDFAPEYLADQEFAEEAMLDYLGSHGRSARWQVQDFLERQAPIPAEPGRGAACCAPTEAGEGITPPAPVSRCRHGPGRRRGPRAWRRRGRRRRAGSNRRRCGRRGGRWRSRWRR